MPALRGLYAITDQSLIDTAGFNAAVDAALSGGARIIQYRDKSNDAARRLAQAEAIRELCDQHHALFIVNDDLELAVDSKADGIHLGKSDLSLQQARQQAGADLLIGISCYNDLERALAAERDGASYVAFGTMFTSGTKPDALLAGPALITTARQQLQIPICAIGGIDTHNAGEVVAAGADMVAVIGALFGSKDITACAAEISRHFG